MHLEYVKNCVYSNPELTVIDCVAKFSNQIEEHPFSASLNDPELHGREIFALIISGQFGPVSPYVAPILTFEEKAQRVRGKRDFMFGQVDPIVSNPLRWAAMTEERRAAWSAYRQALLDVPQQAGFPDNIDWPVAPIGG